MRVLVIDADEVVRASAASALTENGYSCAEASSATEARAVLAGEGDVAAVLCDIAIPGESDAGLVGELVAHFPELAVVATTAADDPTVLASAFASGASGYLAKPFATTELLASLTGALSRRELEAPLHRQVRGLERAVTRTRMLEGVIARLEEPSATHSRVEDTIERLSRAVSLRDEETGRHLQRMSRYAVVLAEALGFTGMPQEDLQLAAALHDVGKIGVPDGILLKPGGLTGDEYTAMQRHAHVGYQLLSGSPEGLLQHAAGIAHAHHEWWDGSGYPRGLRGTEIPEEARIVAVADVFDALTSNRVYRPAMVVDEALAIMRDLRGRQFEPRIFDALLESMDQVAAIRAEFPDEGEVADRIRVLVIDDHEIFVQSLVRLLGNRPELKVVGTAGTLAHGVAAVLAYDPDVVLLDFHLPDGDGPVAAARIKALQPSTKVVMLTARTDDQALVEAIAAGCSGFVRKEDTVEALYEAIIAAFEDEPTVSARDLARLLPRLPPTGGNHGAKLTPRELEVLGLIVAGLPNKDIAQELGLQLNTVRNHVQSVLYKLQAHSKLEAVATAVRANIIAYPSHTAN